MRFPVLLSLTLAGLSLGCADGASTPFPAYGTAVPEAVTTRPAPGLSTSLDLAQAVDAAVALSPSLAAARGLYSESSANVALARTPTAPNLGLQGEYLSSGGSQGLGTQPEREATLQFDQIIFDGGHTIAEIRAAQNGENEAANTYRRTVQTLAFNVAQTFYSALEAESQVRLQLDIVQQDLEQERLISAQIRAGTAARVDLATAEIPTAQGRVAVVRAQGQALAAQAIFATTMGLHADSDVSPRDDETSSRNSIPPGTPIDYTAAIKLAMHTRPDYIAALAQLRASEQSTLAARLLQAPSISVQGNVGSISGGTLGAPSWLSSSQAQAVLTVPIFDQGIPAAQTKEALAVQAQAKAGVDVSRLTVESDVRQALVVLIAVREAVSQTAVELAKAREVLGDTQIQYRAGQTTLSLLLNAQAQLAGAETDRLTAVYALRQAEQAYLYALGENDLNNESAP